MKDEKKEIPSRKQRIICVECLKQGKTPKQATVLGERREHMKKVHNIPEGEGKLSKNQIKKRYFLKEGEPFEPRKEDSA